MSFTTFALLTAVLGLFGASAASKADLCNTFLQDHKLIPETLDGIWKIVHSWTGQEKDVSSDVLAGAPETVWFYTLTPGEISSYNKEMGGDFPSVSWNQVKYSWNIARYAQGSTWKNQNDIPTKFLLELGEEPSGDVTAIPAGEIFDYLKRSGATLATLKYGFKTIGNYLFVLSCESNSAHLLHKGFENPSQADVEKVVTRAGLPL